MEQQDKKQLGELTKKDSENESTQAQVYQKQKEEEEIMIRKPMLGRDSSCSSNSSRDEESSSSSDSSDDEKTNPKKNVLKNDQKMNSKTQQDSHIHSHDCNHHHHHHNEKHNQHNSAHSHQDHNHENCDGHHHSHSHSSTKQSTHKEKIIMSEEDKQALEEVYQDEEVLNKTEHYPILLKNAIKNCFQSQGLDNLEELFDQFLILLTKIKVCDISVLDMNFFKKVILLAQLENPRKSMKVAILFKELFNDQAVLNQMISLSEHSRIVVDVVNSFFILIDKFKNTRVEIETRISFSLFQKMIENLGLSAELTALVKNQTQLKPVDSIDLTTEQKELLEMVRHFSKLKEVGSKQEALKYITLLLGKCESAIEQYKILVYHLSPVFQDLVNVTYENKETWLTFINQVLDLIDRYVFPIEFLINIETTRIQGIRTYHLRGLSTILEHFPKIIILVGSFLNSVLTTPSEIQLNLRALFIIRRLYYFFFKDEQIRPLLEGPIVLILSNVSAFAKDVVQLKEPTLFLHKLLDDTNTASSLRQKLESSERVQYLKQNKYFSVKAKSYPLDIDVQYNFNTLNFQVIYPLFKNVEAGSFFFFNILVTKPDTIIYWSFKTIDYDIKFGLFKMETISTELPIESYEQEKQAKAIVKLQKASSHKDPVMAYSLVNQSGFYRIVFDNSYSYWRSKELLYSIQVLEP